jgi:acetyl/propionyl-CoA carboxylase alpha subunit
MNQPRTQRVKDKVWVQWRGRIYAVPVSLKKGAAEAGPEAQELVAPFSCKVLKLHVGDGQTVKKGDPVVVVEAMKMEYSYAAPRDGRIAKVNVSEGQIVQEGTLFVTWGKDS